MMQQLIEDYAREREEKDQVTKEKFKERKLAFKKWFEEKKEASIERKEQAEIEKAVKKREDKKRRAVNINAFISWR